MSWRPEVHVERKWSANGLRFATEDEAKRSAEALHLRWTMSEGHRAVESPDPVNYRLTGTGEVVSVTELLPAAE